MTNSYNNNNKIITVVNSRHPMGGILSNQDNHNKRKSTELVFLLFITIQTLNKMVKGIAISRTENQARIIWWVNPQGTVIKIV